MVILSRQAKDLRRPEGEPSISIPRILRFAQDDTAFAQDDKDYLTSSVTTA